MYIIHEYQTNLQDQVAIVTPVQKADWLEAQSEFYLKCHYAAISEIPKHTVVLTNNEGVDYMYKVFYHGIEPPADN